MYTKHKSIANRYLYDPLNRLTVAHSGQRFYNGTRIATEIQNNRKTCFFEHEAVPLAELQLGEAVTLLATDQQASVLNNVSSALGQPQSYSPYGYHPTTNGLLNLQGFNGEQPDPMTGHYLLGQGYRAYNSQLMRFNSPDSLSPFGKGGLNTYMYCFGNPVKYSDPTGHAPFFKSVRSFFGRFSSSPVKGIKQPFTLVTANRYLLTSEKIPADYFPDAHILSLSGLSDSVGLNISKANRFSGKVNEYLDPVVAGSIANEKLIKMVAGFNSEYHNIIKRRGTFLRTREAVQWSGVLKLERKVSAAFNALDKGIYKDIIFSDLLPERQVTVMFIRDRSNAMRSRFERTTTIRQS